MQLKNIIATLLTGLFAALVAQPASAVALAASDERCIASEQIIPVFFKQAIEKGGKLGRSPALLSEMTTDPGFVLTALWLGSVPPLPLGKTWQATRGEEIFSCPGIAENKQITPLLAPSPDEQWSAENRSKPLVHVSLPVIDKTGAKGLISFEAHISGQLGSFGMLVLIEKRHGVWVETGRRGIFNS